jgi:hypothetical protein
VKEEELLALRRWWVPSLKTGLQRKLACYQTGSCLWTI